MRKILFFALAMLMVASCGESYEEKQRMTRAERKRLAREDSASLKVGTLPTMDCLPLFVAKERRLFDTLGVDIRLKPYQSQIDCDAALVKGHLEGNVTDLVRAERMMKKGMPLRYATSTGASWQLISNRKSRVTEMKQLTDKMIAMARFSVTHMLSEMALDSVKMKEGDAFLVQINDPNIRLLMLQNNELDAMWMPEPQATTARMWKHPVLMDSKQKDLQMGCIVFREKALKDKNRQKQYAAFLKGYNSAVDSINKYGVGAYAGLIKKYMKADEQTVSHLPKTTYKHIQAPRTQDVERARKWLK